MSRDTYWLRQLGREERTTLIATFSGWMLDGMDVMVYTFVLPSLIALWHISKGQAGLLATSALLLSAVGGWMAGFAADRWGRVRVLQLTICWFAFFTFLSGFTQSFSQLLVIRGLQGLGFGGEWAVGAVLIGEKIQPAMRGRAVGTTQAGWSIGWALAGGFYVLFFNVLPPTWAWRAMFFIGILPALLAFWIRRHVREPQIFQQAQRTEQRHGILRIFAPEMLAVTSLASLVALGAQGGYYAVNTFLPLYLRNRGLGTNATGTSMIVVIAGSFAGYLTSAHLADAIGRRATLLVFATGSFFSIAAYTLLQPGAAAVLALGFPLGFFPSGSFGPMGSYFTELFPTAVRGSGQGFAYNFGRGLGAFFPAFVGYFSEHMGLGLAIAAFSLAAYLIMVLGVTLLPETRGKPLPSLDR